MSAQSKSAIQERRILLVYTNPNNEISGDDVAEILDLLNDSSLNIKDGGNVVQSATGYVSLLNITDERNFTHKKYVDDAIGNAIGNISGYLPLDGDDPMEGPINMDGNDIRRLGDITDVVNGLSIAASNRTLHDGSGTLIAGWSLASLGFEIYNSAGKRQYIKTNATVDRTATHQDKDGTYAYLDDLEALLDSVPTAGNTLNKLYNLIVDQGTFVSDFDASSGAFPTTGSGQSGAIDKGDYWKITVAGTLTGLTPVDTVKPADVLYAKVAGASSASDFFVVQSNVDQATSSVLGLVKLYTDLLASNTDGSVTQATVVSAIAALRTLPVYPGNDNQYYYLDIINGVTAWVAVTYVSGTSIANKDKLMADLNSDWDSTQTYIGTTSGAITGTKGGEKFKAQGGNANWYVYEALADNVWTRYLIQ